MTAAIRVGTCSFADEGLLRGDVARWRREREKIREFVETNEWQIAEIRKALKEADAGDFARDQDVLALAKKWKVNAR